MTMTASRNLKCDFFLIFLITLTILNEVTAGRRPREDSKPLILTPYIQADNLSYARNLSMVNHTDFDGVESYSGYFTVNETCDSNHFFWFFPAELDREIAPVVLWIEGGPGFTSLFSTVFENGPFYLHENGTLGRSDHSWSRYFNLLYIDNPVNTGYSYTKMSDCMATGQKRIGEELYQSITQFFQLFPEMQENDFYITGESYAGKFIPSAAYTIHEKNPNASIKINLKGLAMGDALIDTLSQLRYSPYLFELGLVDEKGKQMLEKKKMNLKLCIQAKDWKCATKHEESLILGGELGKPSLFFQLTGLNITDNYVTGDHMFKVNLEVIQDYFNRRSIKRALHTGHVKFKAAAKDVYAKLRYDVVKSVAPKLIKILDDGLVKVLLYNGQLDLLVPYSLTRDFVNQLQFKGKVEFAKAHRYIWQVDDIVAGYVTQGANLQLALVRNAGHMTSYDQPKNVLELMRHFMINGCTVFKDKKMMLSDLCKRST